MSSAEAHAEGYAAEHCWFLEFVFRNEQLAGPSPIAEVVDALIEAGLPHSARPDVHTVLNELYVNALDYGVLGLQGAQKTNPEDFKGYHRNRQQQLDSLGHCGPDAHHWIKLDCVLDIADRPQLTVTVADSGTGTIGDEHPKAGMADLEQMNNRGLKIVQALVDNIQFYGKRNQIRISYRC